jgi:hypothetical protein
MEARWLKMEGWRLKTGLEGSMGQWSQIQITLVRSRIRIRIK